MTIRWEVHPELVNEDGTYDPVGLTLHVAMRQAEALADLAVAMNRIDSSLQRLARHQDEQPRGDGHWDVYLEEVSPDAFRLCQWVEARLRDWGWTQVRVSSEW